MGLVTSIWKHLHLLLALLPHGYLVYFAAFRLCIKSLKKISKIMLDK